MAKNLVYDGCLLKDMMDLLCSRFATAHHALAVEATCSQCGLILVLLTLRTAYRYHQMFQEGLVL